MTRKRLRTLGLNARRVFVWMTVCVEFEKPFHIEKMSRSLKISKMEAFQSVRTLNAAGVIVVIRKFLEVDHGNRN